MNFWSADISCFKDPLSAQISCLQIQNVWRTPTLRSNQTKVLGFVIYYHLLKTKQSRYRHINQIILSENPLINKYRHVYRWLALLSPLHVLHSLMFLIFLLALKVNINLARMQVIITKVRAVFTSLQGFFRYILRDSVIQTGKLRPFQTSQGRPWLWQCWKTALQNKHVNK